MCILKLGLNFQVNTHKKKKNKSIKLIFTINKYAGQNDEYPFFSYSKKKKYKKLKY